MRKQSFYIAGFLISLTGSILFSTKAIIVKKAFLNTSVDALSLLTIRLLFSLPFYAVMFFILQKQKPNLTSRQVLYIIIMGLLGYYVSSYFDFAGLQYISAGLERLILFLYPTFTVLLNAFLFRMLISKIQKFALLLCYSGIALAYFAEWKTVQQDDNFYMGCLLIFGCAITFAMYLSFTGKLIKNVEPLKFTTYSMLAATVGVFVHYILRNDFTVLHQLQQYWVYGLLLGVVATVVPTFLISTAMKRIGSNNVAIVSSIGPVSTIIQANYFLNERMTLLQLAGTALVVAGVLLLVWKTSNKKPVENDLN